MEISVGGAAEPASRSERRLWAVAFVLAVVGGLLGGMVGIW